MSVQDSNQQQKVGAQDARNAEMSVRCTQQAVLYSKLESYEEQAEVQCVKFSGEKYDNRIM
jgi:hypothetical protein